MTIKQLMEQAFPAEMKNWDKWDYVIHSPLSMDDEAEISVHLRSTSTFDRCTLRIAECTKREEKIRFHTAMYYNGMYTAEEFAMHIIPLFTVRELNNTVEVL